MKTKIEADFQICISVPLKTAVAKILENSRENISGVVGF